jgi:hypothetical protein
MREKTAMTRRIAGIGAALLALVLPLGATLAQAELEATKLYEGTVATRTATGAAQPVHLAVQSWTIANDGVAHKIPLAGFYVAHLQSGDVAATVAGETTDHRPSDFWAVKAGAIMSVKALSELAVIETIAPAKQ